MKSNQAFTLIELLVVVLIIGILAVVVLPQYEKTVIKSRLRTCQVLVKKIIEAERFFYNTHNTYATYPEDLDIQLPTPIRTTFSESISRTTFHYSWGYCDYHAGKGIGCLNTTSGIGYQEGLTTNLKECKSDRNKPIATQVCQIETGKKKADYDDGGVFISYFY